MSIISFWHVDLMSLELRIPIWILSFKGSRTRRGSEQGKPGGGEEGEMRKRGSVTGFCESG